MANEAQVHRIPMRHPGDTAGLEALISSGEVGADRILAVLGKTEGNGCVNDHTRLSWEELPGRRMSWTALHRPDTDPTTEGDWPQQHVWMADTLERFAAVFRPLVLTLPGGSETARAALVSARGEPAG